MLISKYLIELTDDEMVACRSCAKSRDESAIKYQQRTDLTASPETPFKTLVGVMSELAVHKHFGVPYTYPFEYQKDRSDLSNGIEVKGTLYRAGHLILNAHNNQTAPFVSTICNIGEQTVLLNGWRDAVDCRLDKYWRAPNDGKIPVCKRESWWIPQSDLHDMKSLRERLVLA